MTLIDSLEHYYGALDENDRPRPIESPQSVDDPFEELSNVPFEYQDLEDDVNDKDDIDYGPTDTELEES